MAMDQISEHRAQDETARMRAELEQALVAAEDAHQEIARLSQEAARLADENRALRARLVASQTAEVASTSRPPMSADCVTARSAETSDGRKQVEEALRVAMEELTVMAEELERAHDALLQHRPATP